MKSEQIKEITDRAVEQLVAALQAGHSEALTAYLTAIRRFHRYSLHNVLLIASIAAGPFPAVASRFTACGIVRSGWQRSKNRECAGGRSCTTNRWMRCDLAPGSAERFAGGEQEAQGLAEALCDSIHGPDWGGGAAGYFANPAPVSYQATAVDLLWSRGGDQFQRGSRDCPRSVTTKEEACTGSRAERELQSRSEESVQGRGGRGFDQAWSLRGVLCGFSGQGHAARDGTADLGEKDRHDCFDRVEERSELRRPSSEATNSMRVPDRIHSIQGIFSGGGL